MTGGRTGRRRARVWHSQRRGRRFGSGKLLDHYERLLGKRADSHAYGREGGRTALQIFGYEGAVENCRVYVTYGASHHLHYHVALPELLAITDDGWDYIPEILAYTVKRLSANNVAVRNGLALDEVDHHVPEFGRTFGKSTILFTTPFLLPDEFDELDFGHESDAHPRYGHFYMANFITPAEYSYWLERGPEALGDLFDERQVDATHLRRSSCV